MKKIILLFFLVLLACLNINSQTIYMCDFEDDAENQQCDLRNIVNPGLTYANLWHIDKAINNGGERSMYISNDNGQTPGYSAGSMMISSRNLELEPGDYELSFDWLTGSAGGSDALFVAWVPKDVNIISSPNYAKARFLDTYGLSSDPSLAPGMDSLQGASWKTSVFPINNHDGSEHKLVFVWMNNTNSSDNKGACIDNIMIFPKGLCDAPEDLELTYKDNSVIFSWSGDAPQYEVKYYSYETGRWVTYSNLTSNSITLHNITEGIYDFYVRSICD